MKVFHASFRVLGGYLLRLLFFSRDKEQLGLLHHQFTESNKANESLRKELAIYDRVLKLEQTQRNDVDGKSCL